MMMMNLFTSDPSVIFATTGSSRAGVMPCTYCGVTAASSITTPADFADAFSAALRMSSTTASRPTDMCLPGEWCGEARLLPEQLLLTSTPGEFVHRRVDLEHSARQDVPGSR